MNHEEMNLERQLTPGVKGLGEYARAMPKSALGWQSVDFRFGGVISRRT